LNIAKELPRRAKLASASDEPKYPDLRTEIVDPRFVES
jgi:hypothetical protein